MLLRYHLPELNEFCFWTLALPLIVTILTLWHLTIYNIGEGVTFTCVLLCLLHFDDSIYLLCLLYLFIILSDVVVRVDCYGACPATKDGYLATYLPLPLGLVWVNLLSSPAGDCCPSSQCGAMLPLGMLLRWVASYIGS